MYIIDGHEEYVTLEIFVAGKQGIPALWDGYVYSHPSALHNCKTSFDIIAVRKFPKWINVK